MQINERLDIINQIEGPRCVVGVNGISAPAGLSHAGWIWEGWRWGWIGGGERGGGVGKSTTRLGSGGRGGVRGVWCHSPLSAAPPDVFRLRVLRLKTLRAKQRLSNS